MLGHDEYLPDKHVELEFEQDGVVWQRVKPFQVNQWTIEWNINEINEKIIKSINYKHNSKPDLHPFWYVNVRNTLKRDSNWYPFIKPNFGQRCILYNGRYNSIQIRASCAAAKHGCQTRLVKTI